MSKMDPKVKRAWIEALRSGEYKQCYLQLRTENDEFCCLGVLCNLHAQAHPEYAAKQMSRVAYGGQMLTLPSVVYAWSDLKLSDAQDLANMNDRKHSFKQIAQYIEERL